MLMCFWNAQKVRNRFLDFFGSVARPFYGELLTWFVACNVSVYSRDFDYHCNPIDQLNM